MLCRYEYYEEGFLETIVSIGLITVSKDGLDRVEILRRGSLGVEALNPGGKELSCKRDLGCVIDLGEVFPVIFWEHATP